MADTDNLPIPPPPSSAAVDPPAPEVRDAKLPADDGEPARDPNKTYTQDELDKIAAKIRRNARDGAKRESKAYYEGLMAGQPVKQAEPPPAPVVEQAPTRDQFGSYEEFLEAKADFAGRKGAREESAAEKKAASEKAAQESATERANTFKGKLLEKYPDVVERAAIIGHIVLPDHIYDAIHESEIGPDLFNSFVDTPKELERIMALSPSAALREIGKLEARLEAAAPKADADATPKPAAPASRVPPPLRTVGGTAVTAGDDLTKLVDNTAAWLKARNAQLAKKRAGG